MLSRTRFNKVVNDLNTFGTNRHEHLVVQRGALKTKSRGSWLNRLIQYFYKPKNERIQNVANFALHFFREHKEYITNTATLERLVPTAYKGNSGRELEVLITEI